MNVRKASLRYFTGTGNSLRILDLWKHRLEENGYEVDLASINEKPSVDPDCSVYGFCFPVYSYDIPRIAKRYLKRLPEPEKGSWTFLLVTAGGNEGWALAEGKRILSGRGYYVTVTEMIEMPDNYLPFLYVPSPEEARQILENGEQKALHAADRFLRGEEYHKKPGKGIVGKIIPYILFLAFKPGVRRMWKLFKATKKCTRCGLCETACPTGSIRLETGGPIWSKTCEQCMRCMNLCPQKAIVQAEFIGRGSRRNRYMEPHFDPYTALHDK